LKKTQDYDLLYSSYPSILKGYSYPSWVIDREDYTLTSSWIYLLDGGVVS